MRIEDREQRALAIEKFYADIEAKLDTTRSRRGIQIFWNRRVRSETIGNIYIGLLMPAVDGVANAEDDVNTRLTLIQLAARLAAYRARQGHYPATLDELTPTELRELPRDIYRAKPFVYRVSSGGYLLYSTGLNGTDDGGSNQQEGRFEGRGASGIDEAADEALRAKIPRDADDVSIRVPAEPFKLPKPQPAEPSESP
jgi:hypothetical protein